MKPAKTILTRVVMHSKDVENITGKKGRTARLLLQKIRIALGKQDHQVITVDEFSSYMGIKEEVVMRFMIA